MKTYLNDDMITLCLEEFVCLQIKIFSDVNSNSLSILEINPVH